VALTYELGKIADWESVCFIEAVADNPGHGITKGDRIMNPVTETLIFASIAVGCRGISESNSETFFKRLAVYEKLFGAFMYRAQDHVGSPEITPEEVIAHIGLTTNVSPETDSVWLKRIMGHALSDEAQRFKRASERLDKAKVEAKIA